LRPLKSWKRGQWSWMDYSSVGQRKQLHLCNRITEPN